MRHLNAPRLRAVHSSALHVVGACSYALRARPEDDRATWPALAVRCRRALPAHLAWAAALLDPERPLPVICGEAEVREFFHWLESLPNTERVSIVRPQHENADASRGRRTLIAARSDLRTLQSCN